MVYLAVVHKPASGSKAPVKKGIVIVGICTADAIGQYVDEYPTRRGLVLFDRLTLATGGNAVNCSIALRKLGLDCEAVVKVGQDAFGDFVCGELERNGVGRRGVIRSRDASTPFTFVAAHRDGERSFIHTQGTNATLNADEIDPAVLAEAGILFLTGTMVMPTLDGAQSAGLLQRARQAGALTLLDTVFANQLSRQRWQEAIYPCLPHLDYFVPSLPEARHLTGLERVPEMADEFQRRGCRNVVIKLDADGAYCLDAGGGRHMVSAYRVDPVDATGAGDTWCAGFIAGLAQGRSVLDCVRLGHAVAAHAIQAIGASTGVPPLAVVEAFMSAHPGGQVLPAG